MQPELQGLKLWKEKSPLTSVTSFTLGDTVGSGHRLEAHNSGFQSAQDTEKVAKYFEEIWGASDPFLAFPLRLVLNPRLHGAGAKTLTGRFWRAEQGLSVVSNTEITSLYSQGGGVRNISAPGWKSEGSREKQGWVIHSYSNCKNLAFPQNGTLLG